MKNKTITHFTEQKVRLTIIDTIKDAERRIENPAYLELFGNGEMYDLVKRKTKIRILSINNNSTVAKKINGILWTRNISIQDLCEEKRDKFNIIWLDYSTRLNDEILQDIKELSQIMTNNGMLFISLLDEKEFYLEEDPYGKLREKGMLLHVYKYLGDEKIKINMKYVKRYINIPKDNKKLGGKSKKANIAKVYGFLWNKEKEKLGTISVEENQNINLLLEECE